MQHSLLWAERSHWWAVSCISTIAQCWWFHGSFELWSLLPWTFVQHKSHSTDWNDQTSHRSVRPSFIASSMSSSLLCLLKIYLSIKDNFYSAIPEQRPKSNVLLTSLTCHWGSEDVGLKNPLRWYEGFHCLNEIQWWILEKAVFHRKIFHSINESMKHRRNYVEGSHG